MTKAISNKFSNMGFVCACLVVAYHDGLCGIYPGAGWWVRRLFSDSIGLIAVPFFFLASGYFLAVRIGDVGWWQRALLKRVRTLVIPFIVWNLMYGIFTLSLSILADSAAGRALGTCVPKTLWAWIRFVGGDPSAAPALGPLWYVRSLMVLVAVSPVLCIALKRWRIKILVVMFAAYAAVYHFNVIPNHYLYWTLRRALSLQGLFFFSTGMYLKMENSCLTIGKRTALGLLIAGVSVLMGYHVYMVRAEGVGEFVLVPFLIPCMLIGVWGSVPERVWPAFVIRSTFPIFLMHCFFMVAFSYAWRYTSGWGCCFNYCLRLFGAIIGSMAVASLTRRIVPKVYDVIIGGR